MAASNVDIVLRGKNEASAAIKQVKADLGGLDNAAKSLSGGLSSIAGVLGIAGLGATAMQIGRAAVELGNLGQQVQQQRAYFNVWSGSVANATLNLNAMREAVGGAMTDSEAMTGANKLLSMGLAKNADDLAKLSKMAVMLGGSTRSAAESIDEFSLLLANQSVLRLDTFGISGARVRVRIEELMAATQGMTREQAFLNAVMEEGTRKVAALEQAGVDATTAAQDLATAWRQLRDVVGLGLAPFVSDVQNSLASGMTRVSAAIQAGSTDARTALVGMRTQLQLAERDLAMLDAQSPDAMIAGLGRAGTVADGMRQYVADLRAELYNARIAAGDFGDAILAGALTGMAGLYQLGASVTAVKEHFGLSEIAAGQGSLQPATPLRGSAAWSAHQASLRRQEDLRKQIAAQANTSITDDYQRKMLQAFDELSGAYQSAMQEGINFSIGLSDLGGGNPNEPGKNGAFEDIYRLQAFIKDGSWGGIAAQYGLDQAGAAEIVKKFQQGIWDASVMQIVDKSKLTAQIQQAQLGQSLMDAVAADLAKASGSDPKLVKAMLGMGGRTEGGGKTSLDLTGFIDGFLVAVDTDISDNRKELERRGSDIWKPFETGFVAAAKQSAALISAIDGMVASALARRGVAAAAHAAGQQ